MFVVSLCFSNTHWSNNCHTFVSVSFLSFVCPHFSRSSTHVCNCCMYDDDLYLIKSIHTLFCFVLIVIGEAISRLVWNFKFSFLYSSKKTQFIILLPICFHNKLMHSNTQLQQNMQDRILLFQCSIASVHMNHCLEMCCGFFSHVKQTFWKINL